MIVSTRSGVAEYIRDLALNRNDARIDAAVRKSAVPAATTGDSDYSSLAELAGISEFRAAIERRLLPSAIAGAWKIPFNVPHSLQTGPATASWIEQGGAIRVTGFVTAPIRLLPRTVATISVLSKELLFATGAKADAVLLRILSNAIAAAVNSTFVSAAAAAAGAPAGIAAGATGISSTGDTAAQIADDLSTLLELADATDADLSQASWIMSPGRAARIALALGLDGLGLRGGELLKAPVLTDPALGADVLLVDGSRIATAIGSPDILVAEDTTLEMLDNPTNNASGATVATNMVSMFQTDSVAMRATLNVNWSAAPDSVYVISGDES